MEEIFIMKIYFLMMNVLIYLVMILYMKYRGSQNELKKITKDDDMLMYMI